MEDDQPELRIIADSLLWEIREKHPHLDYQRLKLQAPGYAVAAMRRGEEVSKHLFMVKVTRFGILFDTENRPDLPDYTSQIALGMLLRKAQVDVEDPEMATVVFGWVDKYAAVAQG